MKHEKYCPMKLGNRPRVIHKPIIGTAAASGIKFFQIGCKIHSRNRSWHSLNFWIRLHRTLRQILNYFLLQPNYQLICNSMGIQEEENRIVVWKVQNMKKVNIVFFHKKNHKMELLSLVSGVGCVTEGWYWIIIVSTPVCSLIFN